MAKDVRNSAIRGRMESSYIAIDHPACFVHLPKNHVGMTVAKGIASAKLYKIPPDPLLRLRCRSSFLIWRCLNRLGFSERRRHCYSEREQGFGQ